MNNLVLSIFPGIDVAGMGFEELGCCVVRGPDLLWGGDIRRFHPPAGMFWGVIGGPPCQSFSQLVHILRANGYEPRHGNMIPEFERVVSEAQPDWFVMENVPAAPEPTVDGYIVRSMELNNRWLGETQNRLRRFSFGTRDGRLLDVETQVFEPSDWDYAVTTDARTRPAKMLAGGIVKREKESGGRTSSLNRRPPTVVAGHGNAPGQRDAWGNSMSIQEMCRLQGLPENFTDEMPFTMHGKRQVIGNAWTLPMSRAIARAVMKAMR